MDDNDNSSDSEVGVEDIEPTYRTYEVKLTDTPRDVRHFDHVFRIMLIGESGVGKTCVLTRFKDGKLPEEIIEITGGIVFKHVGFDVDGKSVKLQIWDVAGQQRFRHLTEIHYKNKDGFLLFYDVTNRMSHESADVWMSELKKSTAGSCDVFLVANKCDIPTTKREVQKCDGESLARKHGAEHFEMSAVTGFNVHEVFEKMVRKLIAKLTQEKTRTIEKLI